MLIGTAFANSEVNVCPRIGISGTLYGGVNHSGYGHGRALT